MTGGANLYGFSVGILVLDTRFPRIPGDIGNAATFDFPVRYHRVAGATSEAVVRGRQRELLPLFVEGARLLEREGVRAISTSCGFLAKFQDELAASVSIPVFTSSLMLVPLVHRMLPPDRAVGVMTVDASSLGREHLTCAGVTAAMRVVVAGLETEKEFTRVLLEDLPALDVEAARQEHVAVARRMLAQHPEIGAIVLECTNMPPYRADVQAATGLPVFDITTLVRMVHDAVKQGLAPRPG
ncbi:MAG TPA: aspartate/glutamate racemase family protein [Methylomirabilota bacterium]|nr:aspartate/glutamate racemase family protein [Methylomirabilota bacterium]